MLLHSPGAGGLSSPVGGMDGAIPILGVANVVGPATTDGLSADLSWVGTRVAQPTAYLSAQGRGPIARPIAVQADMRSADAQMEREIKPAFVQPITLYTTVLAMLHGWEKEDHGSLR